MLKTNSAQARANIKRYIVDHFDPTDYEHSYTDFINFNDVAAFILHTFHAEKRYSIEYIKPHNMCLEDVFIDWCAGLPSVLDTCYYYNRSAINDLGNILEQTESERKKYSESDAENMLTRLIYRELLKGAKQHDS